MILSGSGKVIRAAASVVCLVVASLGASVSTYGAGKSLQIYFIDTEGGQATLIVSPTGQSMLVDTGWPGFDSRDADRIVAAAKSAGVSEITYVVITHYHRDHVGGVPQLLSKIKVGTFIDHGPNREDSDVTREDFAAYEKAIAGTKRESLKPGDLIPITGINVKVLTADGEHIASALSGAGQENPYCAGQPTAAVDPSENARSLGTLITYGKFRFIDLGDLTKQKELQLVCPNNLVGTVDLYLTTHHGMNLSNSPAIVDALHPRVAIMNNGANKGGSPEAWQTVHDSPGLLDLWQLHYSIEGEKSHNEPDKFIANPEGMPDAGHYIKVTAEADGTFTVLNSRTGEEKTYKK
jgi:beta-lactamase superfamily II metal-dependent hydrolase